MTDFEFSFNPLETKCILNCNPHWNQIAGSWAYDTTYRRTLPKSSYYSGPQTAEQITNNLPATDGVFAIKTDGTLWGWGCLKGGTGGEQTVSGDFLTSSPVQLLTGSTWKAVQAFSECNVAAIKSDDSLWAWGSYGALGNACYNGVDYSSPVQVAVPSLSWCAIAAPSVHCNTVGPVFVVSTSGQLWGWGDNPLGALGVGSVGVSYSSPVQIGSGTNWVYVNVGNNRTSYAIAQNGKGYSWGNSAFGQTGNGTISGCVTTPTLMCDYDGSGLITYRRIVGLYGAALAQSDNCCTSNVFYTGCLSTGCCITALTPLAGVTGTSIGYYTLTDGPTINCHWSTVSTIKFNAIPYCAWFKQIYPGASLSRCCVEKTFNDCIIDTITPQTVVLKNHEMWRFGASTSGSLGNNINGSGLYSCLRNDICNKKYFGDTFVTKDSLVSNDLFFGGVDGNFIAGQNNATSPASYCSPVQITGSTWKEVSNMGLAVVAVKSDGSLWSWGENYVGVLGLNLNTTTCCLVPTKISATGDYWNKTVPSYSLTPGAIKSDGTIWAWGDGRCGTLPSNLNYSSPVQILTSTSDTRTSNWKYAATNCYLAASAAISVEDMLFTWGGNFCGTLGINADSVACACTAVGQAVLSCTCSFALDDTIAAVRTDGTMWTWGSNLDGRLGANFNQTECDSRSSPAQITGGGTSWRYVETSSTFTAAIKDDGCIYIWGQGKPVNFDIWYSNPSCPRYNSSPIQASSWGSGWKCISINNAFFPLGIKQDGTIWGSGSCLCKLDYTVASTLFSSPIQLSSWGSDNSYITSSKVPGGNVLFVIKADD